MSIEPDSLPSGGTFQVNFAGPLRSNHAAFYFLVNDKNEVISVLWSDKLVESGIKSPGFSFDVSGFPILDFPVIDELPDVLLLPDSAPAGRYHVCMASTPLEYCDELLITP